MTLKELDREQQVALVALLEAVSMSDGYVSAAEATEISVLAEALGDATYRERLDEAERRFPNVDSLKAFLPSICDPAARELIYGTILKETLAAPSPLPQAVELREWLRAAWQISDVEASEPAS